MKEGPAHNNDTVPRDPRERGVGSNNHMYHVQQIFYHVQ